jgi:hypothetical protein
MRVTLWILLVVAIGIAVAFIAFAPPTAPIERALESELQRMIGPADAYRVEMDGVNPVRGTVARIRAVGSGIRIPNAPVVSRATIDLRDVSFDARERRLREVGMGRIVVEFEPADLAQFLERHRRLGDVQVDLQAPNRIRVSTRPEIESLDLSLGTLVTIEGTVRPEGNEVFFDVSRIEAGLDGKPVDLGSRTARRLQDRLNPVADLARLPVKAQLESVTVREGRLVVVAVGTLPLGSRLTL